MNAYDFLSIDGRKITTLNASDASWAGLMFLKHYWKAGEKHNDVIVKRDNQVMAVISDRGKRRPDIMILNVMRDRIHHSA